MLDERDLDIKLESARLQGERIGVVYGFSAAVIGLFIARMLGFV